jgi:hypothetical protein
MYLKTVLERYTKHPSEEKSLRKNRAPSFIRFTYIWAKNTPADQKIPLGFIDAFRVLLFPTDSKCTFVTCFA